MADRDYRLPRWAAVLIGVSLMLLVMSPAENPLVDKARGYAEGIATTSAATYVSLRTLNAFLSTAQEVEVGVSLGVGGNAQPLKMLEPIDDTIERIAAVVFAIMVASGVLSIALGPVSGAGLVLIGLAALMWAAVPGRLVSVPRRLFIYGGFFAFVLPLAFVGASVVSERMTGQVWAQHAEIISEVTADVGGGQVPEAGLENGWWQSLRDRWNSVEQYQTVAVAIYSDADRLIESYIAILSVYIFNILLLPMLLVGAFWVIVRQLAR